MPANRDIFQSLGNTQEHFKRQGLVIFMIGFKLGSDVSTDSRNIQSSVFVYIRYTNIYSGSKRGILLEFRRYNFNICTHVNIASWDVSSISDRKRNFSTAKIIGWISHFIVAVKATVIEVGNSCVKYLSPMVDHVRKSNRSVVDIADIIGVVKRWLVIHFYVDTRWIPDCLYGVVIGIGYYFAIQCCHSWIVYKIEKLIGGFSSNLRRNRNG